MVRELIKDLETIGSRTRSDRKPVLCGVKSTEEDSAMHDIVANQACLLPRQVAASPVDKVILCYSQVLSNYYKDDQGKAYMSKLKDCYYRLIHAQPTRAGIPWQAREEIWTKIKSFVANHTGMRGFHHVLTEMAMLELRTKQDQNPESIIPILLHNTSIRELPFLRPTQVWLSDKETPSMLDPNESIQRLVFRLISRIYGEHSGIAKILVEMYEKARDNLSRGRYVPFIEFKSTLIIEIHEELRRARRYPLPYATTPSEEPLSPGSNETIEEPTPPTDESIPQTLPPRELLRCKRLSIHCRYCLTKDAGYLQALSFGEMDNRHHGIAHSYPNTLNWVDQHPSYIKWLAQDSGILGIRGPPGSGKSTVLTYIVKELNEDQKGSHLCISYFNSMRGSQLEHSRVGMYRSLLHQLLSQDPSSGHRLWLLAEHKNRLHEDNGTPFEWEIDELREAFISALLTASKNTNRRIRMFVDALDEAGNEEAREIIADFREIMRDVGRIASRLSICFSCRHYPVIAVNNGLEIRVDENNRNGIARYVSGKLNSAIAVLHSKVPPVWTESLSSDITKRASGSFIWAVLVVERVVEYLLSGSPLAEIPGVLNELPEGIEYLYRNILLKALEHHSPDEILGLFQWILLAERPLTLQELRYARASDDTFMTSELSCCEDSKGFVRDDSAMYSLIKSLTAELAEIKTVVGWDGQESTTVQLIHQSVGDFLKAKGLKWLRNCGVPDMGYHGRADSDYVGASHNRLRRSCGNFIKLEHRKWDTLNARTIAKIPFCSYAAENWFIHAEKAEENDFVQTELVQEVGPPTGQQGRDILRLWRKAYFATVKNGGKGSPLRPNPTLLEIATRFPIPSVIMELVRSEGQSEQ